MKKTIFFALVCCAGILISCKKKAIEILPVNNDPVFHLDGTFGNMSLNAVAGHEGMLMKNGTDNRNGVDYAWGEFSNGNTSIKLGLFDGQLAITDYLNSIGIGDSLEMASKFSSVLANLSKSNFSNEAKIANIDWYVNDVFRGANHVLISQPGIYNVCANFTFADNGAQKTICNTMYLGFKENVPFVVKHFLSEDGDLKLWVEGETQHFDSVVWKIDNHILAKGMSYATNIGNEERTISAKVYHKNGTIREKSIAIDGTFSGRFIEDFSICEMPNYEEKWDNLFGLEVNIGGEKYTSFEVENNKSKIVVKSIGLFGINAIDPKVMKLNVEVDAMLKSLSSGNPQPIKFNAIFAFPLSK